MDLRRVRRLSSVLISSQLRAGRSDSNPKSFFGQPLALAVADLGIFVVLAAITYEAARAIQSVAPSLLDQAAPLVLAFLPLLALGVLLIAGVMFELSATTRFATSDAANWLPITPTEYVLASSTAAAFSYSIILSFALGVGLGIALVTGLLGAFLLAGALSVGSLFLGGLLIEMLRASTQRLSTVVAKRTGRATLVLRIALFLVVILVFQSAFNPIFLLSLLRSYGALGPLGDLIPFLWASRAVQALAAGQLALTALLSAGHVLLIGLALWIAVDLRVRFWVPVAAELKLEEHEYAAAHPILRALRLTQPEASLVTKDLRGLVRRRELLPIVVTPLVLAIFSVVSTYATGAGTGGDTFAVGILMAWAPGFFSLLLATSSFGQERRGIQVLFALPLSPRSVFRAKLAVATIPPLVFGGVFWIAGVILLSWVPVVAAAMLVVVVAVSLLGAFLGLAFAARWSDFQERPRPQFIRPLPMLGALGTGVMMDFGIGIPILLWSLAGAPASGVALVLVPIIVAVVALPLLFLLARGSVERFMVQVPV